MPSLHPALDGSRAPVGNTSDRLSAAGRLDIPLGIHLDNAARTPSWVPAPTPCSGSSQEAAACVLAALGAAREDSLHLAPDVSQAMRSMCRSWLRPRLSSGASVVVTPHCRRSVRGPLQAACRRAGARVLELPLSWSGEPAWGRLGSWLRDGEVRLVSLPQVTAALGTLLPVAEVVELCRAHGVPVLVDGSHAVAQVRHLAVGPTGGQLFLLEGGLAHGPAPCAALVCSPGAASGGWGLPDLAPEVAWRLAGAVAFSRGLGREARAHVRQLVEYLASYLAELPGARLLSAADRVSAVAFTLDGHSPQRVAAALREAGVSVHAGDGGSPALLRALGSSGFLRASVGFYNTLEEVDALIGLLDELTHSPADSRATR